MENITLSFLICMVRAPEMFHAEFQVLTSLSTASAPHPDLLDLGMGKRLSPRTTLLSSWDNWELCLFQPLRIQIIQRHSRDMNMLESPAEPQSDRSGQSTGWD